MLKGALSRLILSHPDAISQEAFFSCQAEYLAAVKKSLLLKGYDKPMMEHPAVSQSIKDMISKGNIRISAIFPKDTQTYLDCSDGGSCPTILRTTKKLERGYIIFDDWGVTEWNSKEPTLYGPEMGSSCLRVFQFLPEKYEYLMRDFAREQERIKR